MLLIHLVDGKEKRKPIVLMARRQVLGDKEYLDVYADEKQLKRLGKEEPALVLSRSLRYFVRIQRKEDGLLVQALDGNFLRDLLEVEETAEWNGLRLTRPGKDDVLLLSGTDALQKFFASEHAEKVFTKSVGFCKK